MHSNLFLRTISAVILAPLVLASIWFGKTVYDIYSIPLYTILLAIFGAGLSWEWSQMFDKKMSTNTIIMTLFSCLVAFLTEANPAFALWMILLGLTVVYWKTDGRLAYSLGIVYICLPILSLGYIYYINDTVSREIVLWLFFVVWATDIGGYVVGKTVGGPKLAPKISAKKTWSGLGGAILFAMLVAYIFALYLKSYNYLAPESEISFNHLTFVLVCSAGILAIVSQIGDFFESYIKRKLNLKDSSNLIPGHGGLFDRVDGLLFAAVVTSLIIYYFNDYFNDGGVLF